MKVYQNLEISGSPDQIAAFLDGFPDAGTGWARDEEKSRRLPGYIAVKVPVRPELPDATLYLYWPDGAIAAVVANIVPVTDDLGPEVYNRIVRSFYSECVQERAAQFGLSVELSADEERIEDYLTNRSLDLLILFSESATKSNAASHPKDREHWMAFLAASLPEGEEVKRPLLEDWLESHGWPVEVARQLGEEYQFALEFVNYMSSPQDTVRAAR